MDLIQATWQLLNKVAAQQAADSRKLEQILQILDPTPPDKITFNVLHEDGTVKENVMADTMTADQKATASLVIENPVTHKPAPVDGIPVWATSDPTVATVVAAFDGMSAVVSGVTAGECDIAVTADADLGTGVNTISGSLHLTITPGANPTITLTLGTPESQ